MSLSEHEIPKSQRSGGSGANELAPEDITKVNRPFYMLAVAGLVVALLFGIAGWLVLALRGDSMPEGLAVLTGSIGGGLVALVTPTKGEQ